MRHITALGSNDIQNNEFKLHLKVEEQPNL